MDPSPLKPCQIELKLGVGGGGGGRGGGGRGEHWGGMKIQSC